MYLELAVFTIMAWLAVPIFLIPLHYFINFWRRIGALYYVVPLLLWVPAAAAVYSNRALLLKDVFDFGAFSYLGAVLMLAGMLSHIWASWLVGVRGTFGWYELFPVKGKKFVIEGPYKYSRHPMYFSHTLMLVGIFLMTGVLDVGAVAVLDFLLSYFLITGLEEKELQKRFGREYADYAKKVPKFFPRI